MKKLTIKKQTKSSITKDIGELELGDFTIFAGENNAGKTNLIRAIIGEIEKEKDANIIIIPAERVLPEAEIKTGAKDPFKKAVTELLDVNFDDIKSIKSLVEDIEQLLPVEFSKYNIKKTELSAKTNAITNDDYIKAIKDVYVKNLIDSITIKDCYCDKDGIKLSEVGQGTQRLIIASLLKYLGDKKGAKFSNKLTYIIFEEPEIYLHPKLKDTLYKTLHELVTDNDNIKVIITTHDPYFIELGRDLKIFRVFRNPEEDNSTWFKKIDDEKCLDYDSAAEINYLVFELPTQTYLLELYQSLQGELIYKDFDKKLSETLEIDQDEKNKYNDSITFITKLRHDLAHPKTQDSVDRFNERGKEAIVRLVKYKKLTP